MYDVVAAFDVIEHIEDDAAFISALSERLVQGGVLLATVPAFQFLWSEHDIEHEHFRRYTVQTIRTLLEAHGFQVLYSKYWNMSLFVPAMMLRLMNKTGQSGLTPPGIIDRVLKTVLFVESKILPHLPYTIGTGIVVVARKKSV